MSRTFSTNCGSADNLNVSTRCDCNPNVCQMREMVAFESPATSAMLRVVPCGVRRRPFERPSDHLDHHVVGRLPRRARPGLVAQPFESANPEAFAPLADAVARDVQSLSHRPIGEAFCTGQHHARSPRQSLRCFGAARPFVQRSSFGVSQQQRLIVAFSSHDAQRTCAATEVQDFF